MANLNEQSIKIALVTGATGFVGSNLVAALVNQGITVRVYSRQPYRAESALTVPEECWFTGELTQQSRFIAACDGVDVVFHCAGVAHSSGRDRSEAIAVNCSRTKSVYSCSAYAGVKLFLYISSIHATEPARSAYAESKRMAEDYLISCSEKRPVPKVVILRPANVYGPGMKGNIITFLRLARSGIMPSLPKFNNSIPMVSVQDLCSVAISAASGIGIEGGHPEIYTVTDNEQYTPNRIESAAYAALERKAPTVRIPRSVLLLAAIFASLIDWLGLSRNQLGLRLYRSLSGYQLQNTSAPAPIYSYTPTATIESEMPKILNSLEEA